MQHALSSRTWTLVAAGVLALTIGAMMRRSVNTFKIDEDMRDAVAEPISPGLLGGMRATPSHAGYFVSPAGRRAEAERSLIRRSRRTTLP